MFKNRSFYLFFCSIVSILYFIGYIYINTAIFQNDSNTLSDEFKELLFYAFIPILFSGVIFCWLGFFLRKSWVTLVGAIINCLIGFAGIPLIVLAFLGYNEQKKIENKEKNCVGKSH